MNIISNATFRNNTLVLEDKLDIVEGKKVKIVIIDEFEKKKSNFMEFVKQNHFYSNDNFVFNREELNER
jgi:hypothetical protein